MKEIKGILFPHFETGTEGVYWALQDFNFMSEPSEWQKAHGVTKAWDYAGLVILESGDKLTVFDDENKTIVWQGVVELQHDSKIYKTKGYHQVPVNVDLKTWEEIFWDGDKLKQNRYSALLVRQ